MDLSKILSISGKSGLFKVVSQLKSAVLVESLTDKRRFPAFAHDKISSMEEIAVFTLGEDKPLKEILKTIYEKQEGKTSIDPKTGDKELKEYFLEVVPDYDQDRVYISDIRKIISWYNTLLENGLLDFSEQAEAEVPEAEILSEEVTEETKPEKSVKKSATAKNPSGAKPGTPRKRKTGE